MIINMVNNKDLNKKFFHYACTKCGTCSLVYPENFEIQNNFIKLIKNLSLTKLKTFNNFCPGTGFSYINKNSKNFSNLIGPYFKSYVGYSNDNLLRKNSASGGVITEILLYLIKSKKVDYVLMPIQDKNYNKLPEYKITKNFDEIKNNSQSIYTKIPIKNLINPQSKKIVFVGLPDQISSIKQLIKSKIIKTNIQFFIGPMVGINMDSNSIDGIKLSYNINKDAKISKLKWREGKWPGYLGIKFIGYKKIKLKKFYYNFLLPFFCSHESLLSTDFSNEDADISVGDAWSPKYENSNSGGISLIWSKNSKGDRILNMMKIKKIINTSVITYNEAIQMHSHMLDFKKRGSQYRKNLYKLFNLPTPNHIIKKVNFKFSRYVIETIILSVIIILKSKLGKILLLYFSPNLLGLIFEKLRYFWKKITKNTKRENLDSF